MDVTAEEVDRARRDSFSHLVHPLYTVLDDSIGCALWFAAKGTGRMAHSGEMVTSSAKVHLVHTTCGSFPKDAVHVIHAVSLAGTAGGYRSG